MDYATNTAIKETGHSQLRLFDLCIFICITIIFIIIELSPTAFASSDEVLDNITRAISSGDLKRQLALILLFLIGFSLMISSGYKTDISISSMFLITLYLVYCFSSMIWAENMELTAKRCITLLFVCIAGLGFSRRYSLKQFSTFVVITTALCIFSAVVFELSPWSLNYEEDEYRMGGLFHPNTLGVYCALCIIALYSMRHWFKSSLLRLLIPALLMLLILILTKSRTSFLVMGMVLAIPMLFRLSLKNGIILFSICGWLLCLSYLIFSDTFSQFLLNTAHLGRPATDIATLTGRTELWTELLQNYFSFKPMLGYGLGGFWGTERVFEVSASQGWTVTHAHSMYLDQLLDLGIIGLFFVLFLLIKNYFHLLKLYLGKEGNSVELLLLLFSFFLIHGIFEAKFPLPSYVSFLAWCILGYLSFGSRQKNNEFTKA